MAELATIARPYAEALFKASSSDLDGTAGWLDQLAAIAGDAQLLQFASNPKVPAAQVFELVGGLMPTPLPPAGQNFLQRDRSTTAACRRCPRSPRSSARCRIAQSGASDAIVYSAFPIDDAALLDVGAALESRFGRKLKLRVELDASLIGGMRAVVGDEVLDTSVQGPPRTNESGAGGLTVACPWPHFIERRKESCNSIPQKFPN